MNAFRKTVFWIHLAAGLIAGISIGIMCFTGVALAFEKDVVAWSESDARRVTPPAADAPRLTLTELARRVTEAKPDARPTGITVSGDPHDAVTFTFGRDGALYADPYTGEVRVPASTRVHDFLHVLEDWHRVLAIGGDRRPLGKAINGACNIAFFFLAVSGLYLWWPRNWSWSGFKAVAVFNWRLTGKARDFNWHNAIGLWCAPVLIVLTLTAMPISYRWAGNAVYRLVGEEPPAAPGQPANGTPAVAPGRNSTSPVVEIVPPPQSARPVDRDVLLATAQRSFPRWQSITFRLANPQRGAQPASRPSGESGGAASLPRADSSERPRSEARRNADGGTRAAQPITVLIKEPGSWPRTATTTLTLHPYSGEILKTEGFADLSTGRQIRGWMRFLHTGEALGAGGQFVAGLACLGGCFLVYTGFALAWRRFVPKRTDVGPARIAAS